MAADKIIAADCHLCAPHLWAERLDCRFCDRTPRVLKKPNSKKGPSLNSDTASGIARQECLWHAHTGG
jgi:hypothetical protein